MTTPMNYVHPPDVPEGMTLAEYRRRTRDEQPKRRGLRRRARARSAARRAAAQRKAA